METVRKNSLEEQKRWRKRKNWRKRWSERRRDGGSWIKLELEGHRMVSIKLCSWKRLDWKTENYRQVWIRVMDQENEWWRLEITRFKRYNNFLRPLEGKNTQQKVCGPTRRRQTNRNVLLDRNGDQIPPWVKSSLPHRFRGSGTRDHHQRFVHLWRSGSASIQLLQSWFSNRILSHSMIRYECLINKLWALM